MSASLFPQPSEPEARPTGREAPSRCRLAARWRRFGRDDAGSVAVIFAFLLVTLCLFIGAAVDFGRWAQARHQTGVALDAAALAGARTLLMTDNVEKSMEAANSYYAANTVGRTDVKNDVVTFAAVDNKEAFEGTSRSYIKPAFLGLAGIKKLELTTYAKVMLPQQPVEVALMLDVTGSMNMPSSKIADLKDAATVLVNEVIKDNGLVRIALVPFAEGVRLPAGMNASARGTPGRDITRTVNTWPRATQYTYKATECVVERTGTNKYTDVGPGPGNYVMTLFNTTIALYRAGVCGVTQKSEVVPLTSDKDLLLDRIENLELSGGTAGQVGTAWAWYTLSPNWNALWPAQSKASAYDDETKKIAILMTDGEYNVAYDKDGIQSDMPGSGSPVNANSPTQARTLCTNMKAKNIEIYTVGFALGNDKNAIATMNQCASGSSKAYIAENGAQLKQAFGDIARRISNIYLSN